MSFRIGIVKDVQPGGYARVMTERKSVCGECNHTKVMCYGCMLSPKMLSRVANPIDAKAGDVVKIYLSSGRLYTAAALFYLPSVVLLLVGALTGMSLADASDLSETALTMGGAGAGLLAGMVFSTLLGRITAIGKRLEPSISSIVKRSLPTV